MVTLTLDYDSPAGAANATLRVTCDSLQRVQLSVAARAARNRTSLYQRRHAGARLATRQRDPMLADLNRSISDHYAWVFGESADPHNPVLAFSISDLTANPLRPHFDVEGGIDDDTEVFHRSGSLDTIVGHRNSAPLFHLEDEPIGDVPYTLLCCYQEAGVIRFAVRHDVQVAADGSLPADVPSSIRSGLKWWAACPPLLRDGAHSLEAFAVRDYDLRHVFGDPTDGAGDDALREIYREFPNWLRWCAAIRARLRTTSDDEVGYHAALGVSADRLILIHRTATIPDIANDLRALGADDGVLLDSGGSCAIWTNRVGGRQGGVLASHWNFRPKRGALVFLEIKSARPALTASRR